MDQEFASIPVPPLPTKALEVQASFLPSLRVSLPSSQGPSPILREGSVVSFAARNELRSPPVLPWLAILQKCVGVALVGGAWLAFLLGLSHMILAALHNQQGELGLGLDSTLIGAKICLGGFLLAAVGVPQWVMANRKLQPAYSLAVREKSPA
jgi:hypothetical protein